MPTDLRAALRDAIHALTEIKSYFRSPGKGANAWSPIGLLASDTTRPARLVEVTP